MQPSEDDEEVLRQAAEAAARNPRSADIAAMDGNQILSDPSSIYFYLQQHRMPVMSHDGTSSGATPRSSNTPGPTPSPTSRPPANGNAQPPARSNSRAIVPTPLSTNFTPITTSAASPTSGSPLGAGPTGRSYVVPPRPKPGRKPATDEPASKRKAQNRESQRAFRARKAAKLTEMQEQADSTNQKHRDEMNSMLSEQHRLRTELSNAQAQLDEVREAMQRANKERDYWKDRTAQIEAQHNLLNQRLREQNYPINTFSIDHNATFFAGQSSPTRSSMGSFSGYSSPKSMNLGCGNCKPNGDCVCITEFSQAPNPFTAPVPVIGPRPGTASSPMRPIQFQPVDPFAEREIDFTAQFASKRGRVEQQPSVSLLAQSNNEDTKCGFCTDDSNCLCRDQSLQFSGSGTGTQEELAPLSNDGKMSGPGSCDACQTNPKQRAWCQRVAQLKKDEFLPPPNSSRTSSISSTLETMEPHIPDASTPYGAKKSIGCNEAFKLFDGRVPMDQDRLDWIGNLRQVPPDARRDTMIANNPRTHRYSAVELDTAGIIATLGNSMQPLQPRQEDGENSDIVRLAAAQQHQRTTQSPHTSPEYAA